MVDSRAIVKKISLSVDPPLLGKTLVNSMN
jgi:hypothetical protein